MRIFLTGATGYIGGSVAHRLLQHGHEIQGLVRSPDKAELLRAVGIQPVIGTLDDTALLHRRAAEADAVIDTASADHRPSTEALLDALADSGKPFLRTSGSSIVCDDAQGQFASPDIYTDDSVFRPLPVREQRVATDRLVRTAGILRGIRTVVLCPTMIYGEGLGIEKHSAQIPKLIQRSRERQAGIYIGKGLNRWSNVHIADVADLYLLALEKAPTGSFFFAESGEASFLEIAQWIAAALGYGDRTESWPPEEAFAAGGNQARYSLASNCRVRAVNARRLLAWSPQAPPLQQNCFER